MIYVLTSIDHPYYKSHSTGDYFGSEVPTAYDDIVKHVTEKVCELMGIGFINIKGKSRERPFVRARQVLMCILTRHTEMTLSEIGEYLGGRDHSTVIHALKSENLLRNEYPKPFKHFDQWKA